MLGHPEYGTTTTDGVGHWIMLINAEKMLTVNVEEAGYFPAQRQVETSPETYREAFDITLVAPDPLMTQIDLQNQVDVEVARGSVATDADAPRQGALMIVLAAKHRPGPDDDFLQLRSGQDDRQHDPTRATLRRLPI